jgi:hypothetical protein
MRLQYLQLANITDDPALHGGANNPLPLESKPRNYTPTDNNACSSTLMKVRE